MNKGIFHGKPAAACNQQSRASIPRHHFQSPVLGIHVLGGCITATDQHILALPTFHQQRSYENTVNHSGAGMIYIQGNAFSGNTQSSLYQTTITRINIIGMRCEHHYAINSLGIYRKLPKKFLSRIYAIIRSRHLRRCLPYFVYARQLHGSLQGIVINIHIHKVKLLIRDRGSYAYHLCYYIVIHS